MFSSTTLIAVVALSVTSSTFTEAFTIGTCLRTKSMKCTLPFSVSNRPLPVSMSSIDDLVDAIDEDELEDNDFLLSEGELDPADDVIPEESSDSAYAHRNRLVETRKQWRRDETDTGSPEFQVAGMTERISYLTRHLKEHPKDFSTRRGLLALVNKRRKLLNYLFREDTARYTALVSGLGIRHKAAGRVQTRQEIYAAYPKQKARKISRRGKSKK